MSPLGPASPHVGGRRREAHVLVAVKDLQLAKSRLAAELGATDRRRLVLAMLADTLRAAGEVPGVGAMTVVTPDAEVGRAAAAAGAAVFADPHRFPREATEGGGEAGLNAALAAAAADARRVDRGITVVALQADLPALRTAELSAAIGAAAGAGPGRAVVVDRHGTGTAALVCVDPDRDLDPGFGPDSARRHIDGGAQSLHGHWPGLRTDVDTIDDLRVATALGVGPHTGAVLADWLAPPALFAHSDEHHDSR
ncbi:2-phospho-L-lactate guanylyltransferase [Rhodococcus triatomae]|uniref:Phosphoenolpyruvate guanylyltransferase n=1 Tax=Rhodococcus triatomae TaxID=300028 RepID=A0A1G8EPL6_9NOCA|nr:2-phospho-L-lactate guanylyltransferase [Rhodococcus triatomae]QNG19256.1 2-phospho-L-lactate guanylyltransferase [Rhodococcus triatomae]QNG24831.1 2-phospho-L-lactate guanylyltransferase [Rhodococcus triatomae]SDH71805.1 2-phospho-L-lactate guanylyltransferase [Rhodococcus triatomae]